MSQNILVNSTIRNGILDAAVGNTSGSVTVSSGTVYLALSSTAPSYNSSGNIQNITEPTDANYVRALIGISNQSATKCFSSASAGSVANNKEIHFPTAAAAYASPIQYWALYTTQTGSTPFMAGTFESSVTVGQNDVVCIKVGQMSLSLMPNA